MKIIKLIILVAIAADRLIGNTSTNKTPWYLPKDLRHFKDTTTGHLLVLGRKTYESFGKPLPNREHIIISRNPNYVPLNGNEFTHVRTSLEQAILYADEIANGRDIIIAGGGEIYLQALTNPAILRHVAKIIITEVEGRFEGDVFFPELSPFEWREVSTETFEPDEKNAYKFTIKELVHFSGTI